MPASRPLDRIRAALIGARQSLRDWASPHINPFLAQSRRVDARGVRWPLTLLFIALLWLAAMGGLIFWANSERIERDFAADGARLWIGLVWVVVWIMARLRDSELLRNEVLKGRFEPIQLMPLSATRRVWLWSAPNSLWGLLISATMLPAIFWALGGGLLELREALLLIFLVILSQWSVPLWTPTAWRMQTAKPETSDKNPLQGMTASSRKARTNDGLVLPPDLAVDWRGWGGGGGLIAPIWLITQFGMAGLALGVARDYWAGLPFHVRAASHEIWLNWPLFLVRWLGEAQPFFAFSLAPITLILPSIVAAAIIRVLRLAAVTGREPFWTKAHLKLWKRAQAAQSALWFLFLLGILWPGAIEGAWLANWFGRLAGTPAQALAAWWIVCVAAGALATTAMWRGALELPVGPLTLRAQAPRAAKLAIRGLGWALAFWAMACLLGQSWPFSALWLQILPASLAMAAVWMSAQSSIWAAQRAPRFAPAFMIWHALWFYGGPVGGALLLILAQFPLKLLLNFAPLSPWTLWLLLRDLKVGDNSIFWIACGAHLSLAMLTGLAAWLLCRDRMTVATSPGSPDNETLLDELTPNAPPNAPALPSTMATISFTRKPLLAPDAWTARLLAWLGRSDNPLLTLETRRALAGNPKQFVLWMLGLQALVISVPALILPALYQLTGYWASDAFVIFSGLLLAIFGLAIVAATGGASQCYDRDRLDGTLELLFLTPRTAHEIAVGKAGPFAIRAALVGLLFAPSFVAGAFLLPAASEPLLGAAYAATPLWVCAFAVRNLAGAHWMALKKRKVGANNVSFAISLGLMLVLIAEAGALIVSFVFGAPSVLATALLLSAIYAIEATWLWKRGQAGLERWRWQGAPSAQ